MLFYISFKFTTLQQVVVFVEETINGETSGNQLQYFHYNLQSKWTKKGIQLQNKCYLFVNNGFEKMEGRTVRVINCLWYLFLGRQCETRCIKFYYYAFCILCID